MRTFTLWQSMIDSKVLLLSLNYVGIVTASLWIFLHSTDYQVPRRQQQHDGRLVDDGALYLRWYRACGLGGRLRSHERATLESASRVHCFHRRACYGRHDDGHMVGTCRYVDRGDWVLWFQRTVLGDAAKVSHWDGCRCGNRMDQFDRQSRWVFRSLGMLA